MDAFRAASLQQQSYLSFLPTAQRKRSKQGYCFQCPFVGVFFNTVTLEPFEISSSNFYGRKARMSSKMAAF